MSWVQSYRSPDPIELGRVNAADVRGVVMLTPPGAMADGVDFEVVEGIDEMFVLVNEEYFTDHVIRFSGGLDEYDAQRAAVEIVLSAALAVFREWVDGTDEWADGR